MHLTNFSDSGKVLRRLIGCEKAPFLTGTTPAKLTSVSVSVPVYKAKIEECENLTVKLFQII